MLDLSVIILARNEELHIRRCLENAKGATLVTTCPCTVSGISSSLPLPE